MDDDKFVGRRGSRGDAWTWKDSQPSEPTVFPHSPEESPHRGQRSRGGQDFARRTAAWSTGVFSAIGAAIDRLGARPKASPPKPEEPATPAYVPPPIEPEPTPEPETPVYTPPPVETTAATSITSAGSNATPRPRPRAPSMSMPRVPEDMRAPLVALVAVGLGVALAIAVLISALDDDDGEGAVVVNPSQTATEALATPDETEAPTKEATPDETEDATPKPTPERTEKATPVPVPSSSAPQSNALALGLWANARNEWWFSDLSPAVAQYAEGQTLPFMVSWQAQPGADYSVQIVYDCATDDALGAIDYLSGMQDFGIEPLVGAYGPQATIPDGAIPVPETDNVAIDDSDSGVLITFGGMFALPPGSVQPGGDCDRQRAIQLPIQALGERVYLLGSLHLATDDVWGVDEGAASHDPPFGMQVVVSGVGQAGISVTSGTVQLGS